MVCNICKQHPATINIQTTTDGVEHMLHVCIRCMTTSGQARQAVRCEHCGMTLRQIKATNRAGCADCYSVFAAEMNNIIHQIHGSLTHINNDDKPITMPDVSIDALRHAMANAIAAENFEEAARLRDEIKTLEEAGE